MKKLLFVLIAITAITFTSCKKDKDPETEIENTYIGTWKLETSTYFYDSDEPKTWFDSKTSEYDFFTEFTADNTVNYVRVYKASNLGCFNNVTYKLEDNLFKFEEGYFVNHLEKGTLEFKDNYKIVVTQTHSEKDSTVLVLTRTNKKLSDIDTSQCL